jgi:translocator protein
MIAFAGWIVWRAQGFGPALWLWLAQLVLNAAWSWIMFGQKEITHALYDMIALWVTIVLFMRAAWPVRRTATLLFVPYFLWVTFAAALNFELWRLNS